MYNHVHCSTIFRCRSAIRVFVLFPFILILFALSSAGFSAEVAQVTIIINTANLTCPLLPTQIIVVNSGGTSSESIGLVDASSNGVACIMRVSGND